MCTAPRAPVGGIGTNAHCAVVFTHPTDFERMRHVHYGTTAPPRVLAGVPSEGNAMLEHVFRARHVITGEVVLKRYIKTFVDLISLCSFK